MTGAAAPTLQGVDPVTFEVLRHRLWAINDEQCAIAARISGSPAVYEAFDFNSALFTPSGACFIVGNYVTRLAASLNMGVEAILRDFRDDPGIADGDLFITNDPWAGTVHTSDFTMIAPVFREGRLLAWSGIAMHELDVGGPVPGSFVVGARDIFEECPIVPPLKIAEGGRYRAEVERLLLRNTRTPMMNALNIRARMAAQNITRQRLLEIVRRYGADTFLAVQEGILETVRTVLRRRLREIPDGTWGEHCYIDHDGRSNALYEIRLQMTKRGDRLTFDFRGTSPQAPGSVNCTRSGLEGGILSALLPMLCYDLPWAGGAVLDVVEIISEEGTVNNATYPAACSMATIEGSWATTNVVNATVAKMLACSERYRDEVQAVWSPATNSFVLSGQDQRGRPLTTLFLTGIGGGGGARSTRDGIDTGGFLTSIHTAMPNVERNEGIYPVLELWRREREETGGPGTFRGGVGIEYLVAPHRNPVPLTLVMYARGVSQPEGRGIYGGMPSSVSVRLLLRGTNLRRMFREGRLPTRLEEIEAEAVEVLPAKGVATLDGNDILLSIVAGGGGYGDPLDRDPARVAEDARKALCGVEAASAMYGVVLDPTTLAVDVAATAARRQAIRAQRLQESAPVRPTANRERRTANGERMVFFRIGEAMQVVEHQGERLIRCTRCGHAYGPAEEDPRQGAVLREGPIAAANAINRHSPLADIVLREFFCPGCGTLMSTDVARRGEPILPETRLSVANEAS